MELSINQSIALALAMKQINTVGQYQTEVFNKAVDAFQGQAEEITQLVSEVSDMATDMDHMIDILV